MQVYLDMIVDLEGLYPYLAMFSQLSYLFGHNLSMFEFISE